MATWADIQSRDHNAIIEAEDPTEEEVCKARKIVADLEHIVNDIRSQGEGPDWVRQWLTKIQDKLDPHLNELTEYTLMTAGPRGYMSRVVAKRKSAWEVATEVGYSIPESSVVQPSLPEMRFEPVASKFIELRNCADDAVRIAVEVEETVGSRYQVLAGGQYVPTEGHHPVPAGLADDADPLWSLEEVSIWWALLSESEHETLINKDPEEYGNPSGIDMASRVRVNELALNGHLDAAGNRTPGVGLTEKTQSELDELSQEIERARENGQEVSSDFRDRQKNPRNRLADLEAVRDQVRGNARATLLVLEPGELDESVRAVIAVGDVNSAQYAATLTPGIGSGFRSSGKLNIEFVKNLKWTAGTYGVSTDGSVTTIAWIDYEAPPDIVKTWDSSVMSIDKAETGAEKLNGSATGIHPWRPEWGLDVYQSIIPHSYGSTTAGVAIHNTGKGAVDGLVYMGSLGIDVYSVGTLGVDPEHTWVSATSHLDPVRGEGPDYTFGRDPEHLEGTGHLSGDTSGGEGYKHGMWRRSDMNHPSYLHKPGTEGKHNYALRDIGKVVADRKER